MCSPLAVTSWVRAVTATPVFSLEVVCPRLLRTLQVPRTRKFFLAAAVSSPQSIPQRGQGSGAATKPSVMTLGGEGDDVLQRLRPCWMDHRHEFSPS